METNVNAIAKTSAAKTFRGKAQALFIEAANASLHDLVDEFVRLSAVIEDSLDEDEHGYSRPNETGEMAIRERRVVVGAARARFGVSFEAFDRGTASEYGDF